ncbi:LacI family transcriptional regulator, partial [Pasteurellaceae bacterium Phil31]
MPTMKDIAKEAEVSLGTVSNVLNEKGNVSLKKIRKVQDAIQKLGYRKNAQAGFLKKGNTNKIAVILPNIRSIKYQSLYEELEYVF